MGINSRNGAPYGTERLLPPGTTDASAQQGEVRRKGKAGCFPGTQRREGKGRVGDRRKVGEAL